MQYGTAESDRYRRSLYNDDVAAEQQRRPRLFDDYAPAKIQQQQRRRVQFDDELSDRGAKRRHSLKADLSGTKYGIGM